MGSLWKSEGKFQEEFHFFHYVGFRGYTQVTSHFSSRVISTSLSYSFPKSGLWERVIQTILALDVKMSAGSYLDRGTDRDLKCEEVAR